MSAILNNIPAEAQITRIEYEGPRIALYTKNPAFLHKNSYVISEIVNSLKKRVVTRTEKSIRKPENEARQALERLFPPEAGVSNYFFDDALGEITVEAETPKVLSQEAGFDRHVAKPPSLETLERTLATAPSIGTSRRPER
jgi:predicted metal-dependent RNase